MQEIRKIRSAVFGGWGDELDDGQFALAFLAIPFVLRYRKNWREELKYLIDHIYYDFPDYYLHLYVRDFPIRHIRHIRHELPQPSELARDVAKIIANYDVGHNPVKDASLDNLIHSIRSIIRFNRYEIDEYDGLVFAINCTILYIILMNIHGDKINLKKYTRIAVMELSNYIDDFPFRMSGRIERRKISEFIINAVELGLSYIDRSTESEMRFMSSPSELARSSLSDYGSPPPPDDGGPPPQPGDDSSPPSPTPRFLRSQVVSIDPDQPREIVEYFRPGVEHLLSIWIGPLAAGEIADGPAFPEEKLQPGPQGSELTVVLVEPNQLEKPLVGKLLLPKEGRSDICDFALPALKPGAFSGTIIVLHRNRVIQTASLSGSVAPQYSISESPIKFKIDAIIRQDLADVEFRDPFEVAIIIGADNTRTTVSGEQACVREMAEVTAAAAAIRETLDAATQLSEPNLDDMLYICAHQGILLRNAVLDGAPPSLAQAQSIQLVAAKPEAYMPLEFCYDGQAPKDDAKACPFVSDSCRGTCADIGNASVICPPAFWGLSRVIERHAYDAQETIETGWKLRWEANSRNISFGTLDTSLVGASARAEARDGTTRLSDLIVTLANLHLHPVQVKDWSEWKKQVEGLHQDGASLLLVIGHTEKNIRNKVGVLEIGNDKLLQTEITPTYIGKGKALAIILGCSTAGNVEGINSFATTFRQKGAAVVIGTTTAVLGRHATPLAKALVERLAQRAGGSTSIRLGALMRDLRLHFLSKGIPIGLATVAFGDADWTFGGAETRQ